MARAFMALAPLSQRHGFIPFLIKRPSKSRTVAQTKKKSKLETRPFIDIPGPSAGSSAGPSVGFTDDPTRVPVPAALLETECLSAPYEFSHLIRRQQVEVLLRRRKKLVLLGSAEGSDDTHITMSDSLMELGHMVEQAGPREIRIVEVPFHTTKRYMIQRISFDPNFSTFFYIMNKEELMYFERLIEYHRRPLGFLVHEKGPMGIGKSMLAYTYGNCSTIFSSYVLLFY